MSNRDADNSVSPANIKTLTLWGADIPICGDRWRDRHAQVPLTTIVSWSFHIRLLRIQEHSRGCTWKHVHTSVLSVGIELAQRIAYSTKVIQKFELQELLHLSRYLNASASANRQHLHLQRMLLVSLKPGQLARKLRGQWCHWSEYISISIWFYLDYIYVYYIYIRIYCNTVYVCVYMCACVCVCACMDISYLTSVWNCDGYCKSGKTCAASVVPLAPWLPELAGPGSNALQTLLKHPNTPKPSGGRTGTNTAPYTTWYVRKSPGKGPYWVSPRNIIYIEYIGAPRPASSSTACGATALVLKILWAVQAWKRWKVAFKKHNKDPDSWHLQGLVQGVQGARASESIASSSPFLSFLCTASQS